MSEEQNVTNVNIVDGINSLLENKQPNKLTDDIANIVRKIITSGTGDVWLNKAMTLSLIVNMSSDFEDVISYANLFLHDLNKQNRETFIPGYRTDLYILNYLLTFYGLNAHQLNAVNEYKYPLLFLYSIYNNLPYDEKQRCIISIKQDLFFILNPSMKGSFI